MLWLVIKDKSYQITSCNLHEKDGSHQLWVECPNGRNIKIVDSKDPSEAKLVKNAIDHAVRTRETTLELE